MRPVLFSLFGYPISSYGFFMMLAQVVGIALLFRLSRAGRLPLGPLLDVILATAFSGLVGARLGYAFNHPEEFRGHAGLLFSLRQGGLSFYGGFPFAFLAFVTVLRWRKIPVFATSDLVAPVLPFTLGLMRIGCFLEGCCYGRPSEMPWAVTFHDPASKIARPLLDHPVHPTQLYEAGFLFALAVLLAVAQRKNRLPPGVLATFSIFAYSLYRLAADSLRGDLDPGFAGIPSLTPTQAAALLGVLATPIVLRLCVREARRA
jgi:phosphatidylglycerol:prolipoprotein diacylglycerol transferase